MSPVYNYHCKRCGEDWESFHRIDDRENEWHCGKPAIRLIPKTQGKPIVLEYFSENLDARVTGPKQKRRIMKEKDLENAD